MQRYRAPRPRVARTRDPAWISVAACPAKGLPPRRSKAGDLCAMRRAIFSFDDGPGEARQKGQTWNAQQGYGAPAAPGAADSAAADQHGLRRRGGGSGAGGAGDAARGANDKAAMATRAPAPTNPPAKAGSSRKARGRGCGSCCGLVLLLSVGLLACWIAWVAVCDTVAAGVASNPSGPGKVASAPVSREDSGSVETVLKANGLLVYAGAMKDLGLAFVADLVKVTDDDIVKLHMKPIHANKLRHLRETEKKRQAAAVEAPLEPDDQSPPPGTLAHSPAVCAQARDAGTRVVRAVGEYVGHDVVAAALQPLMGVHAAAMAPEVGVPSCLPWLAFPPNVDILLFPPGHLSCVCSASFFLIENGWRWMETAGYEMQAR